MGITNFGQKESGVQQSNSHGILIPFYIHLCKNGDLDLIKKCGFNMILTGKNWDSYDEFSIGYTP
jgi:hypothetical protein